MASLHDGISFVNKLWKKLKEINSILVPFSQEGYIM